MASHGFHRLAYVQHRQSIHIDDWTSYVLRNQLDTVNQLALRLGNDHADIVAARAAHAKGLPYVMGDAIARAAAAAAQL
jgi:hypothetical protein